MSLRYIVFFLAICIFIKEEILGQANIEKHTLSGYIREFESSELLPGVAIYSPSLKIGTVSNTYGFYSLTLPKGDYKILYSFVGYALREETINLIQDVELSIFLTPEATTLEEVEIVAQEQERVSESIQMSNIKLPVRQIQDIPILLGERDVLKVLQLVPGVQSGSEGNSGLYVRGGGRDQNLLILDDAIVYNSSHLFGFFSIFNGDALKNIELYKGGFPSRFGGRLSSVLKMDMKEGNKDNLKGKIGIGLISANGLIEGPIVKNKASFLISGRRTYIDALARLASLINISYYFYDLNAKVNYDFGKKNKIYLSGYFGEDRFNFIDDNEENDNLKQNIGWGNSTATFRWNHLFNNRLFSNASLVFSSYTFGIFTSRKELNNIFQLDYKSRVRDYTFKYDMDYIPNPMHYLRGGVSIIYHNFIPSALVERDDFLNRNIRSESRIETFESGIYIEDDIVLHPKINANIGIRLSHFVHKKTNYSLLEPRFSISYKLRNFFSLKAAYASMNQYIHLLSNSGVGLPTDLWVSSTERVRPQASQQVAFGLAKDFIKQNLILTVEGYYKASQSLIQYKEGATFLVLGNVNSLSEFDWQDNITTGKGWSYGAEILLQRKFGRLSGWIGYTLSWSELQFEELNFGRKFFARYDRRHDISIVAIYKLKKNITLSGTWVYGTGNLFTLPVARFATSTSESNSSIGSLEDDLHPNIAFQASYYNSRNNFRADAYHRLDLGIQFHKDKKRGKRTWQISIYNVYNRKNPFFYFIEDESNIMNRIENTLKQVSLFPIIPSISYRFEFN